MDVGCGARVNVERDAKLGERLFDDAVVAVDDILRCNTFSLSLNGDGHTVLVATANHEDFAALEAKITGIDVGGDVYSGEVADVDGAVGVWESSGDEGAFEIFHNQDIKF